MYEYNKLRGRIVEKYGSQAKFAEVLGVTVQTVNYRLNGKRQFSQQDIEVWSKLLDINKSQYLSYFFT